MPQIRKAINCLDEIGAHSLCIATSPAAAPLYITVAIVT